MKSLVSFISPWLRLAALGGTVLSMALSEIAPRFSSVGTTLVQQLIPPEQSSRVSGEELRILTANVWHDFPRHRDLDARWAHLARTIETEQVDIACLQEVPWRADEENWGQWLGETLGWAYTYGRANGDLNAVGFEEGLAILSRYPLRDPQLIEVQPQSSAFEHRAVLRVTVEAPAGDIHVYCVHLTTNRITNARQVDWLVDFVEQDAGDQTAIIAGDYNARDTSPQIASLTPAWEDTYRVTHPTGAGLTFSLDLPLVGAVLKTRYDYIFHRPGRTRLSVQDSHLLFTGEDRISDHHAVLTTFR